MGIGLSDVGLFKADRSVERDGSGLAWIVVEAGAAEMRLDR